MRVLVDMVSDGVVALLHFGMTVLPWALGFYCLVVLVSFTAGVYLFPLKLLMEWNP